MTNVARVEVSAGALRHNIAAFRRLAGKNVALSLAVKANGYGHGLEEVACCVEDHIDAFQIDDLAELRRLRTITRRRAMVLGYVADEDVAEAVALGGELALYDPAQLPALEAAGAKVHLKVDTGFGRLGMAPFELDLLLDRIRNVEVVGIYSHLACVKSPDDVAATRSVEEQSRRFAEVAEQVRIRYPEAIRHLAATAGALTCVPAYDLLRLGIGVYGDVPVSELGEALPLRPSLRWVSCLAQVKRIEEGQGIGYDHTFVAPHDMRIGLVPQGYSDGYSRSLSNVADVLVHGHRCRVVGRVSMNMLAIDVTAVPDARRADEVVLLGRQGEDAIRPAENARLWGTAVYEVLTSISPALPRVVVD